MNSTLISKCINSSGGGRGGGGGREKGKKKIKLGNINVNRQALQMQTIDPSEMKAVYCPLTGDKWLWGSWLRACN